MKYCYSVILFTLFFCLSKITFTQQNTLTFGLNVTYFSDWKKGQFLNFFNPEIGFSKQLNGNYTISTLLNAFYGAALHVKGPSEGKVIDRLIFSNDYQFEFVEKGFFVAIGPTIRYRHEKKILHPYPFEIVIDPNKSHFDIGGAISSGYKLKLAQKSSVTLKMTYRFYNKGVNPVSVGVSLSRTWN